MANKFIKWSLFGDVLCCVFSAQWFTRPSVPCCSCFGHTPHTARSPPSKHLLPRGSSGYQCVVYACVRVSNYLLRICLLAHVDY